MTNDFKLLESETEYGNVWYNAGYKLMRQPDGTKKKYYYVDMPNAVTIVPTIENRIVMVEEYRPVTDKTYVSCPTGVVEDGEQYVETANRELVEETGYEAEVLNHVQSLDVATGVLNHERGVVVAEGLHESDVQYKSDENEFIRVEEVEIDDALEMVRERPTSSASIEALLLAKEDDFL